MALADKLRKKAQHKLLAIDGGGIRGVLALEVLNGVERLLRKRSNNPDLRLGDYFDYVAGTSTGAIIAACLARGMQVSEVLDFYKQHGSAMFEKASLFKRLYYEYESEPLAQKLREVFGNGADGTDLRLGDASLKCLLMVVLRNFTTDSPWPVSSNPAAKYNDRRRPDCNLDLPLWKLVRASAAAPTFFPPEHAKLGSKDLVFVDGGVTTYNNPSFLLFLMSTVEPYKLAWPAGEERMLVVSVGTGSFPAIHTATGGSGPWLLDNAKEIPGALMYAAQNEQDMLCRVFGRCAAGGHLDNEIGDLRNFAAGPVERRLFRYVRYNAELTKEGMAALGLPSEDPVPLRELDSVERIPHFQLVGQAVARVEVKEAHFA